MARLTNRKLAKDQRGISDVLSIAFMFLILVFAGMLLHAYKTGAISSATSRQAQMKAEYFYKTAELAQVENYSLPYFDAIMENLMKAENLMETEPVVPGDYLRESTENLLGYLCPAGYGLKLELMCGGSSWVQLYPEVGDPGPAVTQFTFSGKLTKIVAEAENRVVQAEATVTVFKL